MIVTNNDAFADKLRSLRSHGWIKDRNDKDSFIKKYTHIDPRFMFVDEGYNVRSTDVNAAIGVSQLQSFASSLTRRKFFCDEITKQLLSSVPDKIILQKTLDQGFNSRFAYPIVLKDSSIKKSVIDALEKEGIETRPIVAGNMLVQPVMKYINHKHTLIESADFIQKSGFYIGVHDEVSNVNEIIRVLIEVISNES